MDSIINCVIASTVTKGRCARLNSAGTGGLPLALVASDGTTATGHYNVGIFLASGVSGDIVPVQVAGVCEIATAGAAIAIGKLATTDASGKVVACASGDRGFLRVIGGKSSAGATADGAECRVVICGPLDVA